MNVSPNQSLLVPKIDVSAVNAIDVPVIMQKCCITYHSIEKVNWNDYPYCPQTQFAIAYTPDSVLLHFKVKEADVRGFVVQDLGPVSSDSCVEFFACMGDDDVYYNIECNCLGYISMGARKTRNEKEHASSEILQQIKRWTTFGSNPMGEIRRQTEWECAIVIPFTAFFKHSIQDNSGQNIRANFYKCGGSDEYKHYVSWNPIKSEKPDFHRPECFGLISF